MTNNKIQINSKIRFSKLQKAFGVQNAFEIWNLTYWCLFGIYCLGFRFY
jgi:hypothetical protein